MSEGTGSGSDAVNPDAALVAQLRAIHGDTAVFPVTHAAADLIEALTDDLSQSRKWLVETEAKADEYKARLARAEVCMTTATNVLQVHAISAHAIGHGDYERKFLDLLAVLAAYAPAKESPCSEE